MMRMTKTCTSCGETKPVTSFAKRNNRKSGRQSYCKPCRNKQQREARKLTSTIRSSARTGVYIWTDIKGRPCYVGITGAENLKNRNSQHRCAEYIWTDYAIEPTGFHSVYDTREEALEAEAALIGKLSVLSDLVNKDHNPKNSDAHYNKTVQNLRKTFKQL